MDAQYIVRKMWKQKYANETKHFCVLTDHKVNCKFIDFAAKGTFCQILACDDMKVQAE